jgi:hypothetical protein
MPPLRFCWHRLEAKRAAKEREIYGSMDFKPQLNPRSLRMAKVWGWLG